MDRKKDLHMLVIDQKKTYDWVLRKVLWEYFERNEVSLAYIWAIKEINERVKENVRNSGGDIEDLLIDVAIQQVLALSLLLFGIFMDELLKWIQDEVL